MDYRYRIEKKGVQVSEPIREGERPWFAHFQDLDGNQWGRRNIIKYNYEKPQQLLPSKIGKRTYSGELGTDSC